LIESHKPELTIICDRRIMDRPSKSDAASTPSILPPVPLASPSRSLGLGSGMLIASACMAGIVWFGLVAGGLRHGGGNDRAHVLSVDQTRFHGAFTLIDTDIAAERPFAIASMTLTETERLRVKDALRAGRIRIASVTLWDNMDEDGDIIDLSAAGFTQRLVIMNKPKTFFLPVVPGSTVRITGIKDGGGGGITLGVGTVLGPIPLPPLAMGQSVEVPAL
jgi:hypothetical protein